MARVLAEWHYVKGAHGRVCPEAFAVDRGGRLRLNASPIGQPPAFPYAAPEQALLLGAGVDERSDLYAMGVIFYEMLAGRSPFVAVGAAAWGQRRSAERPPALSPLADVPAVVEQIVVRLLAQAPGERYQSAVGLAADLDRCRKEWVEAAAVNPFPLGSRDIPERLMVGGRLYGRESRLTRLRSAYEKTAVGGGAGLVCVTGEQGVGRSALLAAFGALVVEAGGRVVAEKVDQHQARAPYATVARLLAQLAAQLVAEPAQSRARWRSRLVAVLGSAVHGLLDLAPGLTPLLDEQPSLVRDLPASDARRRMHLAVCRFLAAVAADGPLLIVIDDLHHGDVDSLDLLGQVLAAPDMKHLLVLGSHVPGVAGGQDPLTPLVHRMGGRVSTVPLRPLSDAALCGLLADTLRVSVGQVSGLAGVVAEKAGSNPAGIVQFLHYLGDRQLLKYDPEQRSWTWQRNRIRSESAVASPRRFVSSQLRDLEPRPRRLLDAAAVLGNRFDCRILALATGERATELAAPLQPAVRARLLVPLGGGAYRWASDQVRRATLALVSLDEFGRVGRTLLGVLSEHERDEWLFELAGFLNASAGRTAPAQEDEGVAEVNLAAGRKARRLGALAAARGYFAAGLAALPAEAWSRCRHLACDLHAEAAQAEHMAGDHDRARRLLDVAMGHAHADLSQVVRLLAVYANLPRLNGEWDADAEPALRGLRLLGVDLPGDPGQWASAADAAVANLRPRLAGVRVDDVTGQPRMTGPQAIDAAKLLATLLPTAQDHQPWLTLLSATGVAIALDHGYTGASTIAFAYYGLVLADRGEYETAALCTQTALRLVETIPAPEFAASTKMIVALSTPAWFADAAAAVDLFRQGYLDADVGGEVPYIKANQVLYPMHLFMLGARLDQVAKEVGTAWRLLEQYGDDGMGHVTIRTMDDIVSRLRGVPTGPAVPPHPNERALAELSRQGKLGYTSTLNVTRMLAAAYLLGDHTEALDRAETAQRLEPHGRGRITFADRAFYHALTLTARYEAASPDQQQAWSATLDTLQAALDELAACGPATFGYQALLVSAERARLAGHTDQAAGRYVAAIGAAREHGILHGEAIAAELGGRYALVSADPETTTAYFRRARHCYEQWGAATKVEQIDDLLAGLAHRRQPTGLVDQLELLTVVNALQAISAHIELDKLLPAVLEQLIHLGRAERGCILLPNPAGAIRQAAVADTTSTQILCPKPPTSELEQYVPVALVQHIQRTGQPVAGSHNDLRAIADGRYLTSHQSKSMLCAPISRADQSLGILYLEHRGRSNVFTGATLERIEMLCAHAAIAMANATSYHNLKQTNQILHSTVNQLPIAVILVNPDLTVRHASPQATRFTGTPIRTGTPLTELFDHHSVTRLAAASGPAASPSTDTEPTTQEIIITRQAGQQLRVQVSAIPDPDSDGNLLGFTLLLSGI